MSVRFYNLSLAGKIWDLFKVCLPFIVLYGGGFWAIRAEKKQKARQELIDNFLKDE